MDFIPHPHLHVLVSSISVVVQHHQRPQRCSSIILNLVLQNSLLNSLSVSELSEIM